jgi:putative DNA primase/helicase
MDSEVFKPRAPNGQDNTEKQYDFQGIFDGIADEQKAGLASAEWLNSTEKKLADDQLVAHAARGIAVTERRRVYLNYFDLFQHQQTKKGAKRSANGSPATDPDGKKADGQGGSRYRVEPEGLFFYDEPKKLKTKKSDPNKSETEISDDDDEPSRIWLSPPFEIVARTRDPDGHWGKLLQWKDHDDIEVKWVMPARLLGGHRDELWQALYEKGLEISSGVPARNLLLAYLTGANPLGRASVVSRLGWHTDNDKPVFVLPDRVFGGGPEIVYGGSSTSTPYRVAGSLAEWRDRIGRLCIRNSRLVLAVSVAFAGPLLHLVGEENGGFHFKGNSRDGKTTTLLVGRSPWGCGLDSWRATSNGLEGVAEVYCDALLCLDEMGQVDPREVGEIAYMRCNGSGKRRASRDGSARATKQWRILFLSSGEISLSQKMNEIGKKTRAGQEIRLVDIPANAGAGYGVFEDLYGASSPGAFAEQLKQATKECYGTPIREYLTQITHSYAGDPTQFATAIRTKRDDFINTYLPETASGQVRSVCGRFGVVAAAGEMATGLGLTGWPEGEAEKAAATCFTAWLEQRGTIGDHDLEAGIKQVISFIELHGNSRFEEVNGGDSGIVYPVNNRVGYRRWFSQEKIWRHYVLPEAWKNELTKGYDPTALANEMVNRGLLIRGKDGKNSPPVYLPGIGTKRVYELAPAIIADRQAHRLTASDYHIDAEINEYQNNGLTHLFEDLTPV